MGPTHVEPRLTQLLYGWIWVFIALGKNTGSLSPTVPSILQGKTPLLQNLYFSLLPWVPQYGAAVEKRLRLNLILRGLETTPPKGVRACTDMYQLSHMFRSIQLKDPTCFVLILSHNFILKTKPGAWHWQAST